VVLHTEKKKSEEGKKKRSFSLGKTANGQRGASLNPSQSKEGKHRSPKKEKKGEDRRLRKTGGKTLFSGVAGIKAHGSSTKREKTAASKKPREGKEEGPAQKRRS